MSKKVWVRFVCKIAVCGCAALSWWGMLYPELTMTPDTYRIVEERADGLFDGGRTDDSTGKPVWDFEGSIYAKVVNAAPGTVRLRSRIWEEITGRFLRAGEKKDTGD